MSKAALKRKRRVILYAIMRKGGLVQVRHLGTFDVDRQPARLINLNGRVISKPAKKAIVLRYSKRFRDSLNLAPQDASGPQSGGGGGGGGGV